MIQSFAVIFVSRSCFVAFRVGVGSENGLITDYTVHEVWKINTSDPSSAEVEITWTRSLGRDDWEVSSKIVTRMQGQREHFHIQQNIEAFEGDIKVFERTESDTIPR